MSTKKRMGIYEHFCILILAQGNWKEYDRNEIRNIALSKRKEVRDFDYHFYHRLTYRDAEPNYSDCLLCKQIYRLFLDLKDNRDHILYQGHHYILPEDYTDLADFVRLLFSEEKVKKIYILYFDSLKEYKREDINNYTYEDFRSLINQERYTLKDFSKLVKNLAFKPRVLYDIIRKQYY